MILSCSSGLICADPLNIECSNRWANPVRPDLSSFGILDFFVKFFGQLMILSADVNPQSRPSDQPSRIDPNLEPVHLRRRWIRGKPPPGGKTQWNQEEGEYQDFDKEVPTKALQA